MISVAAERGTGTGLYSLTHLCQWPGVRFVPVLDAPWDQSVLAVRSHEPRPEVQTFRTLARLIAQEVRRRDSGSASMRGILSGDQ